VQAILKNNKKALWFHIDLGSIRTLKYLL